MSGDTLVLTSEGVFEIESLVGRNVMVWNGLKWSPVTVVQTGAKVRLVRVVLNGGYDLICTPEHKFVMANSERKDAISLVDGDVLGDYVLPVIEGSSENDISHAELRGFYKNMDDCIPLTRATVPNRIEWL